MRRKVKVVAVMPAYNEAQKINQVISRVERFVDSVIVVDDGSVDETSEKARGHKVVILKHLINLGHGAALQTGFEYAKLIGADVVVTFDADGQFRPHEIKKMTMPILNGEVDVTLGSRFLGSVENLPWIRWLVLKAGIVFTQVFSGVKLTDAHNGFRAFSSKAISKIHLQHNRWAAPSEIIFQIAKNQLKYKEIPVTVVYSRYSKAKGQGNFEALKIPFDLISRALFEK